MNVFFGGGCSCESRAGTTGGVGVQHPKDKSRKGAQECWNCGRVKY